MDHGDDGREDEVDVRDHEKTFNNFLRVAAAVGTVSILILIFLAIVGT
ncbi:MAG: aa3-type cytochrome c oxidase subunit IV [Paracoccaceae bacterium]